MQSFDRFRSILLVAQLLYSQDWDKTDPRSLFDAPVRREEANAGAHVCKHLQKEAKGVDYLVLWLDCDREGENICFEVRFEHAWSSFHLMHW